MFQVNCSNVNTTSTTTRLARIMNGETGEVLDKLEIFNSVEVIAPEIELDDEFRNSNKLKGKKILYSFKNLDVYFLYINNLFIYFCLYYNVKYKFAHRLLNLLSLLHEHVFNYFIFCTLLFAKQKTKNKKKIISFLQI